MLPAAGTVPTSLGDLYVTPRTVNRAVVASIHVSDRRMTAGAGVFTLTGNAAGLRAARNLTAETGVFVLTGHPATLTYSGAGGGGGVAYSAWYTPVTDGQQVRLTLGAGWKFQ